MQRIPPFRAGGGYRLCFRVGVGVVDPFRDSLTSTDAVQVIAVGNVGVLILLPAACTVQRPSAK